MTACSLFILGVSLYTGPNISTFTGIILLIVGIMYLVNPAFVYDDEELELKNLYGMTMRRYSFDTDQMEVRDGRIYANGKKIRVAGWVLVPSEYKDLLDHIQSNSNSAQTPPRKGAEDILDNGIQ